jgi:hypothetical protein
VSSLPSPRPQAHVRAPRRGDVNSAPYYKAEPDCLIVLGVPGATKRLLTGERGRRTVTRKIGGITDPFDLTAVEPLLLLTRDTAGGFTTRLDTAARYAGR